MSLLDLTFSGSVEIPASLNTVWKVLTVPSLIKEYLYGTETITSWVPGSDIVFQGEYQGTTYRDHGKVVENIPGEKISYTYWSGFTGLEDLPENYSLITFSFKKMENGTTLFTWTQKGFSSQAGYDHSSQGMSGILDQIKEIALREEAASAV